MFLSSRTAITNFSSNPSRLFYQFLSILCLLFVALPQASAEGPEKKFGRLADGRAYRVDSSGFRLVDQVAELEVTVDELRRQLEASQNEIKDQARTISRLKGGESIDSGLEVQEKNLIKSAKIAKPVQSDPPNCNELVSNLYLKVAALESKLQQANHSSNTRMTKLDCPQPQKVEVETCDYNSEKNPLWNQVQRLQQELMSGPSKERVASQRKSLGKAEKSIVQMQAKLAEQSSVTKTLETELSARNAELEQAQEQLAALDQELSEAREENKEILGRAALKRPTPSPRKVTSSPITVASTPAAKRLQQKFSQQLRNIQSLILRRKDLLDAYEKRGGSYQTSPLVTTNGMSLDSLRAGVAKLDWKSNSATIEDGLKEIESVLRKDIRNLS